VGTLLGPALLPPVLVTRNVREFALVPRLEVESWYEPA
jgi:hypothetical protein